MRQRVHKTLLSLFIIIAVLWTLHLHAEIKPTALQPLYNLDNTIERSLTEFNTPGMSVAVVKDGEIVYLGAKGFRNLETKQLVTEHTQFRLASTSKAFTAAALAILVEQNKLAWNDKVIEHLPEFQLQDPWVTREFTIVDLLTHKSGLVSGAGDSMIWPEPSGFNRNEVVQRLKYLTPAYSFRQTYAYSNVLYITAGELIARVSGMPFEQFVDTQIFNALNMHCFAGDIPKASMSNIAVGYGYNTTRGIYSIPRNGIQGTALMSSAAGGMVCNSKDMATWIQALLSEQLPFSPNSLDKMWTPNTILGVSETDLSWHGTHFRSYGLGWRLENMGGYKVISHTGTISGFQAYVALIPELSLGAVVLNNGSNYGARSAVMLSILTSYLPKASHKNWVNEYVEYQDKRRIDAELKQQIPIAKGPMQLNLDNYLGAYIDDWFGEMVLSKKDDEFRLTSSRMKTLRGTLTPYTGNSLVVKWDNQNAASDAFLHFNVDPLGEPWSFVMHPYTVEQKENHEYRDMLFIKKD